MDAAFAKTNALFCKPFDNSGILFEVSSANGKISFRSLDLSTDLDTIYHWVNQQYATEFWQMNGSKEVLKQTYLGILDNPAAHSFIALLDDLPVGQVDLYLVEADELAAHVNSELNDCGLHLLMLPPKQSKKDLSKDVLQSFISFFFSHLEAGKLYAEPDSRNAMANLLAKRSGFNFLRAIELSSKTANLYCIERNSIHQ